jgi:hypothetical protein
MKGEEPSVERQELGERVMGLIGSYRMGTALNTQNLFTKTATGAPLPNPILTGDEPRTLAT